MNNQEVVKELKNALESVSGTIKYEFPENNESNDKLSDENIEEITETLKENLSEESKSMREIREEFEKVRENPEILGIDISNNSDQVSIGSVKNPYAVKKELELKIDKALVEINPVTGERKICFDPDIDKHVSISDMQANVNNTNVIITDEQKEALKDYGFSNDDALKFFNLVNRYKSGEKFSIYNEMPESMKQMVRNLCAEVGLNRVAIQTAAKDVLEYFINSMNIEQEIMDLNTAIKKELNIPNMMEMYADHLKEKMEVDLMRIAESTEKDNPEKAELLKSIVQAFKDSYTLSRQKELLKDEILLRKLNKWIKKYDRYCMEFNFKNKDTKVKIKDISMIAPVLDRVLSKEEYNYDDIRKYVVLLCEICKNMRPDKMAEHTFMYYSIQHIVALDYVDIEKSQFNKELLNNIKEVLDIMKGDK